MPVHVRITPSSLLRFISLAPTNPLSPDMKMHILLTVLRGFRVELVRRNCLNIKTSYPW